MVLCAAHRYADITHSYSSFAFARKCALTSEGETQQHRVSHAGSDGPHQVAARRDTLHQNSVDSHPDHDKHPLIKYGFECLRFYLIALLGSP